MQPFQVRLLSMVEEYMVVREEKEQEKKRQRVFIFFSTFLHFSIVHLSSSAYNI
jgi:hypothetical protein